MFEFREMSLSHECNVTDRKVVACINVLEVLKSVPEATLSDHTGQSLWLKVKLKSQSLSLNMNCIRTWIR
jgi:hypothetical protein